MNRPMTDEEIQQLINSQKFDITKPTEFYLEYAIDTTSQKTGQAMIEVGVALPALGEKFSLRDWLLVESNNGYAVLKVKRFMQSIGLEEAYMAGDVNVARIMSKNRKGLVYLQNREYINKEGLKKEGKEVREYVKSDKQEKLGVPDESDFKEDADIPF
jgi:hypothetical protein